MCLHRVEALRARCAEACGVIEVWNSRSSCILQAPAGVMVCDSAFFNCSILLNIAMALRRLRCNCYAVDVQLWVVER